MEKINLESWERREIYEAFKDAAFPFYHLASFADVTKVRAFAKQHGCSFYSLMVWLASRAANRIENFRYRRIGDEVFLPDTVHPSFTTMKPGSHLYQITRCRLSEDPLEFCARVRELTLSQTTYLGGDDFPQSELLFLSSVPWLNTTSISNAHQGGTDDCVPRICWGAYNREDDSRYLLNIFVETSHQFVDGYHVGVFFRELQTEIENL